MSDSDDDPQCGFVKVQFNHYNYDFRLNDGKLTSKSLIQKYCLNAAYAGKFKVHLYLDGKQVEEFQDKRDIQFIKLKNNKNYVLKVEEDDVAEDLRPKQGYVAAPESNTVNQKRKEGCSCLFGNPCMDADACQDWNNRYDVAKKNGWKGF